MRTDREIYGDVVAALESELGTTQRTVGVTIADGVITLTGYVPSVSQKIAAEHTVAGVRGVRAIAEGLHVMGDATRPLSDTTIAHAIVAAVPATVAGQPLHVTIRVEDGWVTLGGTVPSARADDAVDRALECVSGVRGVTSEVRVAEPELLV
jgi:osmotically-inducible protein OsmY